MLSMCHILSTMARYDNHFASNLQDFCRADRDDSLDRNAAGVILDGFASFAQFGLHFSKNLGDT